VALGRGGTEEWSGEGGGMEGRNGGEEWRGGMEEWGNGGMEERAGQIVPEQWWKHGGEYRGIKGEEV